MSEGHSISNTDVILALAAEYARHQNTGRAQDSHRSIAEKNRSIVRLNESYLKPVAQLHIQTRTESHREIVTSNVERAFQTSVRSRTLDCSLVAGVSETCHYPNERHEPALIGKDLRR